MSSWQSKNPTSGSHKPKRVGKESCEEHHWASDLGLEYNVRFWLSALLQDTRWNESNTSKQLLVAVLILIFFKNMEFHEAKLHWILKMTQPVPAEDRKTELADCYLLHPQSLSDLTKYQSRICAATASKTMFLSKYNKGDFIFALTFRQWLNSFCSSHTLTHGNAGLMGLEGRNNPRSIFRK